MRTVLFVAGPALGHVGRSLVVARATLESTPGVRVFFAYVTPGHGDRLLPPEFECIRLPYRKRGDEGFADQLELTMRNLKPDLICLDLSPVPWLCLVRFPQTPRAYLTNSFLASLVAKDTWQDRRFGMNVKQWNDRRFLRGLPELCDTKTLYDADAVLLCDPPGLVPPVAAAEPARHVVGPCIWQPHGCLPTRLHRADRLLVISLGSTGRRPLPRAVVEKLRHSLDCDLSVWVTSRESVPEAPSNDLLLSRVPLDPILQRSVLAVTQGGAGSTYAALLQGVPVAVWPTHHNHEILAESLIRAGIGALLSDLANSGPLQIRRKVAELKEKARQFRRTAPAESGPVKAAEVLLSMI